MDNKNNKKMMIIIIALLVILLALIVGVSVFVMKLLNSTKTDENVINESNITTFENIELIKLDAPINSNLRIGLDGKEHYISINLSVAVNSEEKESADFIEKVKNSQAIIRSAVLDVVRGKTYEELKEPSSKDIVSEEILGRLQEEFTSNLIVKLYISEYAYQ